MLEGKRPPRTIFRIARRPDPWQPADWSRANPDGTFGNRFDDPEGYYRVLYAATRSSPAFSKPCHAFVSIPRSRPS